MRLSTASGPDQPSEVMGQPLGDVAVMGNSPMAYIVRPHSLNGLSKKDDRTHCSFLKIDIAEGQSLYCLLCEFHPVELMLKGRTVVVA